MSDSVGRVPVFQKKICILGGHAVGKTSLVRRFVKSIFTEKYHTNIGVKVDKKVVALPGCEVSLMIWDLVGEDAFGPLELSYLRGAAGYLLVVDGTRRSSLDRAFGVQQRVEEKSGRIPFIVLINKADLAAEWEVTEEDLGDLAARGWPTYRTSAKTGESVETVFHALAEAMLRQS
jgi:hypothetical protein